MEKRDELFDWKHLRLWRISAQADFFSKIVLVIYILTAIAQSFEYIKNNDLYISNLTNSIFDESMFILKAFSHTALLILQGLIYYVILRGVALGLNMIVETDINYRDNKNQEGEE